MSGKDRFMNSTAGDAEEGHKEDLSDYIDWIDWVLNDQQKISGGLDVMTGPPRVVKKRDGREVQTGRGVNEYAEANKFKRAAHHFGKTARIKYKHQADGITHFTIRFTEKGEMNQEAIDKRDANRAAKVGLTVEQYRKAVPQAKAERLTVQQWLDAHPENKPARKATQ